MINLRELGTERGSIPMALLAIIVVGSIVSVVTARSIAESRNTQFDNEYATVLHVAEAGAYALVPKLNADPDNYVTVDGDGQPYEYVLADGATPAEVRQWLLAIAEAAPSSQLVSTAEGDGFAIRPVDSDGNPLDVVYAVGWVPNRDGAVRRRMLKLRFDSLRYRPDFGLFTGGHLTFGGDAKVLGQYGNVHTNGNATTPGGDWEVDGDFTAHGTCPAPCAPGAANHTPPNINARDMYQLKPQAATEWFDLCPPAGATPATVQSWSPTGPCNGDVLWTSGQTQRYRGWRFHQSQWSAGSDVQKGVYYVYQRNATLGAGPSEVRPITVIAEEKVGDGGAQSGHIGLTGAAKMRSALSGLTLIADRDITMSGEAYVEGFVGANEQIELAGDVHVVGAVVAQNEKDTPSSWVTGSSSALGDARITYDVALDIPLTGVIRIIAWNEL
jgi:hypothetical protein